MRNEESILRDEIKEFLKSYVNEFIKLNIDISSLILFGSQARGTATVLSDIDIAVVMIEPLTSLQRGLILNLPYDINENLEVNLFYTTEDALQNAEHIFDTNKYIREEGITLWQKSHTLN